MVVRVILGLSILALLSLIIRSVLRKEVGWKIVAWVFFWASFIIFVSSVENFILEWRFLLSAHSTKGTIVDAEGMDADFPKISFNDDQGRLITTQSHLQQPEAKTAKMRPWVDLHEFQEFKKGQVVRVYFDPQNPTSAQIQGLTYQWGTAFSGLWMASCSAVLGGVILYLFRKKPESALKMVASSPVASTVPRVPAPPAPVSIKRLSKALAILLIAYSLTSIGSAFNSLPLLSLFSQVADTITDFQDPQITDHEDPVMAADAVMKKMRENPWIWLHLAIAPAAGFAFLIWLYRAYKNLYAFGVKGMASTPEWAVLWWFVPIKNLFKPCQVMSELWRASDPGVSVQNPDSWKGTSGTALIPLWWASFLAPIFGMMVPVLLLHKQDVKTATHIFLGTQIVHALSAIFLILIVRTISQRQEDRS